MGEVQTSPIHGENEDGEDVVCFTDDHTLADIVRWIMQNRSEAEDIYVMLGDELQKTECRLS